MLDWKWRLIQRTDLYEGCFWQKLTDFVLFFLEYFLPFSWIKHTEQQNKKTVSCFHFFSYYAQLSCWDLYDFVSRHRRFWLIAAGKVLKKLTMALHRSEQAWTRAAKWNQAIMSFIIPICVLLLRQVKFFFSFEKGWFLFQLDIGGSEIKLYIWNHSY